jgi:mannan endo-1,4-beta-mannosidase
MRLLAATCTGSSSMECLSMPPFPAADTTYQSVSDFAAGIASLQNQPAQLCPLGNPNTAPVIQPVPDCPTGYEGPNCDLDINECVRGTDDCDLNAACINTVGGFQCQCFTG